MIRRDPSEKCKFSINRYLSHNVNSCHRRKKKFEEALISQQWKVNFGDIKFRVAKDAAGKSVSRRYLFASSSHTENFNRHEKMAVYAIIFVGPLYSGAVL